jgi:hypothetical protein
MTSENREELRHGPAVSKQEKTRENELFSGQYEQ